jgi:hypothetical protein
MARVFREFLSSLGLAVSGFDSISDCSPVLGPFTGVIAAMQAKQLPNQPFDLPFRCQSVK